MIQRLGMTYLKSSKNKGKISLNLELYGNNPEHLCCNQFRSFWGLNRSCFQLIMLKHIVLLVTFLILLILKLHPGFVSAQTELNWCLVLLPGVALFSSLPTTLIISMARTDSKREANPTQKPCTSLKFAVVFGCLIIGLALATTGIRDIGYGVGVFYSIILAIVIVFVCVLMDVFLVILCFVCSEDKREGPY